MLETLKALCALHGVSGNEGEVRDFILSKGLLHEGAETDVMGNVLVSLSGAKTPKKKILLCSHMDEVGVIVTGITDDGYLKFATAGNVDKRVVVGKTVIFGKDRVLGVIGCKAVHLLKAKDREKVVDMDDLYIDIGVKSKEEAEKIVTPGDAGAFDDEVREFGDGFIKAKALDDRVGCTVLLELIMSHLAKRDLPVDCTFAFTVQEEVGLRGANTVAFKAEPDIVLVIEGTTAADLPSVSESKKICKVGAGVVIPFMDGATIYDKELRGVLISLADKNGIKWQTKNVIAGATDGAVFQRSRAGAKTVGIAAPVRNLHSPSCVAKLSDIEDVLRLARLFLEEMGEQC